MPLQAVSITGRIVGSGQPAFLIAEIEQAHDRSFDLDVEDAGYFTEFAFDFEPRDALRESERVGLLTACKIQFVPRVVPLRGLPDWSRHRSNDGPVIFTAEVGRFARE